MKLNELKDKLIEKNFRLDDDGFVRSIRNRNFNGNNLLSVVSFNDLEMVFDAGAAAVMVEVEKFIKAIDELKSEIHIHNCPKFSSCRICEKLRIADKSIADWQRFTGKGEG